MDNVVSKVSDYVIPKIKLSGNLVMYRRVIDEKFEEMPLRNIIPTVLFCACFLLGAVAGFILVPDWAPRIIVSGLMLGFFAILVIIIIGDLQYNRKTREKAAAITDEERLWRSRFNDMKALDDEIEDYHDLVKSAFDVDPAQTSLPTLFSLLPRLRDDIMTRKAQFEAKMAEQEALLGEEYFRGCFLGLGALNYGLKKYPAWQEIFKS